jgi:threonine/homoserine/homoserine lactone efflux protein
MFIICSSVAHAAYTFIRLASACYLIYLGIQARHGFMMGLLNPTLLPPIRRACRASPGGALSDARRAGTLIGGSCDLAIAFAPSMVGRNLRASPQWDAWTQRLCGSLYMGLGLTLLRAA